VFAVHAARRLETFLGGPLEQAMVDEEDAPVQRPS
jgi:hypothetical protein